ncbi:hypothetical protein OSB04_016094 [Centaurea solstitialis]|uniref:NB-ARC domain-containing protein n=1 Tax=Centaurea solstitialis TaxID=347529 RepID=A0AA38WJD1_9ASTR|nr:hypothetical protein OSB04_016094 [Centaurea solstitialis]
MGDYKRSSFTKLIDDNPSSVDRFSRIPGFQLLNQSQTILSLDQSNNFIITQLIVVQDPNKMAYAGLQMFMDSLKLLAYRKHHPLINENSIISSNRPRFKGLYKDLSIIQTLCGIHHLQPDLKKVKSLRRRFKDAAEKAEDIIDLLVSAAYFKNSGVSHKIDVFKTSLDLKKVMKSINCIKVDLQTINSGNMKMRSSSRIDHVKSQSAAAWTCYTRNPLGIKKPSEEFVVGLIVTYKATEHCLYCWYGGLGKTTLANKVFNDHFVVYHFHVRAWVTVSQSYKRRDLLIQILTSIGIQQDLDEASDSQLREKLHKKLIGRRYLIVIDDIWSIEAWDELKLLFPHVNAASRILLTTRLNEVALHVKPHGFVQSLSCLTEEESWKLLKQKVFHGDECPEWLIEPGKQIARRCQGLPLSLVVMAGVLAKEPMSKDLWEEIACNISSYHKGCLETLALSYHHLPDHLTECFLYLGGFPEDFRFHVERLIWLWVAEGFIEEVGSRSLEDTAKAYLMDLISRNLVIVAQKNLIGDVEACKGTMPAKAKEKRLYLKIDSPPLSSQLCEVIVGKPRCVFTNEDISVVNFTLFPTRTIRSLFCFHTDIHSFEVIQRSFVLLKVLDLQKCQLHDFPEGVTLLVHLRYLAVWYSSTWKSYTFPKSICQLQSLQTLILHAYFTPVDLPCEVHDLLNLRNLWSDAQIFFPTLRTPMNLQSISKVKFDPQVDYLQNYFPILKKLDVFCFKDKEYHFELFLYLETLVLRGSGYQLGDIWFSATLKKLSLISCKLPWSKMSNIQLLPKLEVLKLCRDAFMGTHWDACEQQFRQLKLLMLKSLNIKEWEAFSTSFPCLIQLTLQDCYYLEQIPLEIGNIANLELIEIDSMNNYVVESVKRIQQEQHDVGNNELNITVDGLDLSFYLSEDDGSEQSIYLSGKLPGSREAEETIFAKELPPRSDTVSKTYLNRENAMRSIQQMQSETTGHQLQSAT